MNLRTQTAAFVICRLLALYCFLLAWQSGVEAMRLVSNTLALGWAARSGFLPTVLTFETTTAVLGLFLWCGAPTLSQLVCRSERGGDSTGYPAPRAALDFAAQTMAGFIVLVVGLHHLPRMLWLRSLYFGEGPRNPWVSGTQQVPWMSLFLEFLPMLLLLAAIPWLRSIARFLLPVSLRRQHGAGRGLKEF